MKRGVKPSARHTITPKRPGYPWSSSCAPTPAPLDESIRRDKIAAAEAAQRELHARNLTIATGGVRSDRGHEGG